MNFLTPFTDAIAAYSDSDPGAILACSDALQFRMRFRMMN